MSTKKIDSLYQEGKEQADPFTFYWMNLRPHLLKYANTIGRSSTRQVEEHLVEEMVDDLLMRLFEFKGDSKFSSWVYVIFQRRFIAEHRFQLGNLGDSLEAAPSIVVIEEPDLERDAIVADFIDSLTPRNRMIWEMYRDGHTHEEIGESLGITGRRVGQIWEQILELGKQYGETSKNTYSTI